MFEVIPGILEKDFAEIEKKIQAAKNFTKSLHVDIVDGKFAKNTSFLDPSPFSKYSEDVSLELHMMVENPIRYLKSFSKAGFKRFIAHAESLKTTEEQAEFVAEGQLLGEVGLAIDGPSDLSLIKVPYSDLDTILVMTIKAGESGQKFNPEYLKKIELIKQKEPSILIEVDGGINNETISMAKVAGAKRFVSTTYIFDSQNPKFQFDLLRGTANLD